MLTSAAPEALHPWDGSASTSDDVTEAESMADADDRVRAMYARAAAEREKLEREKEAQRQAELRVVKRMSVAQNRYGEIKNTLIERGVPKESVDRCTSKHELRALALEWQGELNIEWDEGDEVTEAV